MNLSTHLSLAEVIRSDSAKRNGINNMPSAEHLENLKDTVEYARKRFTGKVFLGGGSMGGPLAYACDSRYNCSDGLICWCLWDISDKEFMINKKRKLKPQ